MCIPIIRSSLALERMRNASVDVLPVVSRANIHEICGMIGLAQIFQEYGVNGVTAAE